MRETNHDASRQEQELSSEQAYELAVFGKLSDQIGRMLDDHYSHELTLGTHYTPELVLAETDEALDLLKLSLFLGGNQPGYSPIIGFYRIIRSKESQKSLQEPEVRQLDMGLVKRSDLIRHDRPKSMESARSDLIRLELAVSQFSGLADSLSNTSARKLGFSETYIQSRNKPD